MWSCSAPNGYSCTLVLLKNGELGLDFQKSEQKADDHLSYQPHHFEDGKPSTERGRGEVTTLVIFKDPPPPRHRPARASRLSTGNVSTALFFVPSGPCFDGESTSYQFPNLTYSSGAAQMLSPPENLLWASTIQVPQPSNWSKYFLP